MDSLKSISNNLLLEAFTKAIELKMEPDFCDLMKQEIRDRGLTVPYQKDSQI